MAKGPTLKGEGATDYERYIRTGELLQLQKQQGELAHADELLFQTTHQSAELWLKLIDFEIDRTAGFMNDGKPALAADLLERCKRIIDLLREQILVLETMAPADYHVIRLTSLGHGSGQESPGFNRILDAGQRLWPPFEQLIGRDGVTPLEIERTPSAHYDLHRLLQAMLGYDESFMNWRFTHMRMAMRIIGSRVKSLKGVPVTQLESGTREMLFPLLWETISELTDETKPDY